MLHDQAAGFALDALDREEASAFERHLGLCPGCEDELEPLRLAAVALAFAGELPPPPPELRRRVLKVEAVVIPFRRRALPLLSAAAIAACMVVALGLRARGDAGLPPLGDATAFPLHGAAHGSLLVSASGEAVLVVRGLPPAPFGKAYEIWVVARGRATHAGFLRGSMVELSRTVPPGGRVAVTVEDAVGSETPTGPFVLRAETA